MQVSQQNVSADAGLFYIILVDVNGDTQEQELVTANQGEYAFTFDSVSSGQYRLFAGSDADDDAILCDGGEACGAYPPLDSPEFIAINDDLTGLDFESNFRINLTSNSQADTQTGSSALPTVLRIIKLEADANP